MAEERSAEQIEADKELYRLTGIDPREVMLLREAFANPETAMEQKRLLARVNPKTRSAMPELLIRDELDAAKAELKKETDAYRAEREKDQQERTRLRAIREAMDDPSIHLQAHEVGEVEKLMTSRYIGNYKDATRLLRAEASVAPPRMDAGTISLPGQIETDDKYFTALWNAKNATERDRLAAHEAATMLHEFKTGRGQQKYAHLMTV